MGGVYPNGKGGRAISAGGGFKLGNLLLSNIVRGYYLDEGMVLCCMDSITPLLSAGCNDKGDILTLPAGLLTIGRLLSVFT